MNKYLLLLILISFQINLFAQNKLDINGYVYSENEPIEYATIYIQSIKISTFSDEFGNFNFENIPFGNYQFIISALGFKTLKKEININAKTTKLVLELEPLDQKIEEVVVTGNMKESYIQDSPVKIEIISSKFLEKTATNNIIEAIQSINGVQEQINCGVCGTNDIHINGMEGPYTLVLIDGMPIVSALASTYGFNGIPNSIIKRVEIVKGSASSLYGSEAVGGVINIITKEAINAPKLSFNSYLTSHLESNTDIATSLFKNKKINALLSINYYYNQKRLDKNNDNFTDIPLNNRLSIFNKWEIIRKNKKTNKIALRYYTENRFGGEMQWKPEHRGGNFIYGESIYTNRIEVIGSYELPTKEALKIDYSFNNHHQNSYYGTTLYNATQSIAFANFIWHKTIKKHDFLVGSTLRYQIYDDNTPATASKDKRFIPGIFVQDEFKLQKTTTLLLGSRVDYHLNHGFIPAPRIALMKKMGNWTTSRLNFGKGFRLVNIFTEEHAALSGSREVLIEKDLKPEESYNVNFNINHNYLLNRAMGIIDFDLFYTYFTNKIIPDYETNQNAIIYNNLAENAIVRGGSISIEQKIKNNLNLKIGLTYQDVFEMETENNQLNQKIPQLFTPKISGTFVNTYHFKKYNLKFDWIGRFMGPQHLPTYAPPFERPSISKWYSIQHLQITKEFKNQNQLYFGVKNLWNFTQNSPLINPEQPFSDTFDTNYAYAPLQTRRFYIGFRKNI